MHTIHVTLVACRFAHDAAAMILWGAFGFLVFCVPEGLVRDVASRLGGLAAIGVGVTFATAIVALPVKTAMIGDGWWDAIAPDMLWAVLTSTSVGTAWLVDVLASLMLILALFVEPRWRDTALATCSGLVLSSLVLTGHAMMREGWLGYLQQANDLVHVLASGAWIGALIPLAVVMRGYATEPDHCGHAIALRRFSAAGQIAVTLILLTGIANTLLIVGSWPTNWRVPYQALLCGKIGLVLAMIALACRNRFVLAPQLDTHPTTVAAAIRKAVWSELALGLLAVALVAVFGLMDPTP